MRALATMLVEQFRSPYLLLFLSAGIHDIFPAIPWQDCALGIFASVGKRAFVAIIPSTPMRGCYRSHPVQWFAVQRDLADVIRVGQGHAVQEHLVCPLDAHGLAL